MALLALLAASLPAQRVALVEEPQRGFLFEIAGGAGSATYPDPMQTDVSYLDSLAEVDRVTLALHATTGWALSNTVYATLGVYAVGDRLFDLSGGSFQINSYLYSPGIRWYPFTTGLVLGADAGASRVLIQSSSAGTNASPWGYGWRGVAAYDFAGDPTGFSLTTGLAVGALVVDGGAVGMAAAYVSLMWK
jgi:hypothetical protein